MMPVRDPGENRCAQGNLSRRALLATPLAVALAAGGLPAAAAATTGPNRAAGDGYIEQGFNALAAYVLPGDDEYSRRQGVTSRSPGGVAAGTAAMLVATYDHAVQVAVAPGLGIDAPGAAGIAAVLDVFSIERVPRSVAGPFVHSFANLTYRQKGSVLAELDQQSLLQASPLGYAFGTLATLTALGAFSEAAVIAGTTVRARPVGWQLSRYGGVSDGWPELKGYWGGRRAVADPDDD